MPPKSRHSLTLAAVLVGLAAIGGIAAIEGWLPKWLGGDDPAPKVTPTAPLPKVDPSMATRPRAQRTVPLPESLSPGESVVTAPETTAAAPPKATTPPPAAAPAPAPTPPPARKPARSEPTKTKPPPPSTGLCRNCGVVIATTYRDDDFRGAWEVRVKLDEGTVRILRYPADHGFRVGDRVFISRGRLHRE